MDSVFLVNFVNLIKLSLPINLRKPKILVYLTALFSPLIGRYNYLVDFRKKVLYIVAHNSSITLLQKMLNDKFDSVERRIYIKNIERKDIDRFYYSDENKEFGYYDEGNVQKGFYYIFQNDNISPDYIVHIPIEYQPQDANDLDNYLVRVRSEINRYNHYSKTYIIQWID